MGAPRIDQINLVVVDVQAVAQFLTRLGIEVPAGPPDWAAWDAHHREVPAWGNFSIDLDSTAFARQWGGLDASFSGVVVNVRVDERPQVDRLHELALSIGARSLMSPYDAFWGSRYAVVEGPASFVVGFISPRDEAHRSDPPDPSSFT